MMKIIYFITFISFLSLDGIHKAKNNYKNGRYSEAIKEFLKVKKNKNFDYYFYLGHSYSFLNKNELSIKYYDSAVLKNSKKDIVFFERGFSNFILGNSKEALSDLNQAILINSKNAKYYINRGSVKHDLGLVESACNDWNIAMKLDDTIISYSLIEMNCN